MRDRPGRVRARQPANGIVQAGDGIASQLRVAVASLAPRFGVAYDVTGSQKLVLRGSVGLFFDRPDGNSVFSAGRQSAARRPSRPFVTHAVRLSAAAGWRRSGAPTLSYFPVRYDVKLPSSFQWNFGGQMSLPWSSTLDVSYVGNHSYNLLSGTTDINAPDLGAAFAPQNQDPTLAASTTPGANALSVVSAPCGTAGSVRSTWPACSTPCIHSIQTTFNRRFRDGLVVRLHHTLGLSFTGNTGTQVRLQHNPDEVRASRRPGRGTRKPPRTLGNRRHTLKANAVWDLPDVHGSGGALTALEGDRQRLAAVGRAGPPAALPTTSVSASRTALGSI